MPSRKNPENMTAAELEAQIQEIDAQRSELYNKQIELFPIYQAKLVEEREAEARARAEAAPDSPQNRLEYLRSEAERIARELAELEAAGGSADDGTNGDGSETESSAPRKGKES